MRHKWDIPGGKFVLKGFLTNLLSETMAKFIINLEGRGHEIITLLLHRFRGIRIHS
jgi:hypothetical protein